MTNLNVEHIVRSPKSNEILDTTKKGLGFVLNMYENMGANTALLDAYT